MRDLGGKGKIVGTQNYSDGWTAALNGENRFNGVGAIAILSASRVLSRSGSAPGSNVCLFLGSRVLE